MWVCILYMILGCGCSQSQQRTHEEKGESLKLSRPKSFPFHLCPISTYRIYTGFILGYMIFSWPAYHTTQQRSHRSHCPQASASPHPRRMDTLSLRPHSVTYISITQRQLLAPNIVPYEYKRKLPKTYRQERQKKSTQRAQPRKLAKLGMWEWQNFITAETISVSHIVTWVKWESLS